LLIYTIPDAKPFVLTLDEKQLPKTTDYAKLKHEKVDYRNIIQFIVDDFKDLTHNLPKED
jgi:translation initiation factor IF-2